MNRYTNERGWKIIHTPRRGKKLVVLDIDQTLTDYFDARTPRPFLHDFLEELYRFYDIIIWSATPMRPIKNKLTTLGILHNNKYKILGYLGKAAMTRIKRKHRTTFLTKELNTIWRKFPQYDASNTVILDDDKRNFVCNPPNGILIRKFYAADYERDYELFFIIEYLIDINRSCLNFEHLNNAHWRKHRKTYN